MMFQFIAKEEMEKNERTQMKQLTLEINERQEEEELQVKRSTVFFYDVAKMAGELFHEHKLQCSSQHIVFCLLIRVILAELIDDDKDTIFYVLTQEAIQQLQRVSVGGQRDQHRGARGFRPPKVFFFNNNKFIFLLD